MQKGPLRLNPRDRTENLGRSNTRWWQEITKMGYRLLEEEEEMEGKPLLKLAKPREF